VVVKITPQVTDLAEIARAVEAGGGDAICASNTIPALPEIDLETDTPSPDVSGASAYSGLSGAAIRPITLRAIAEIARATRLPITGTGGPVTWRDAAQFLLAGATTVQFCTAVMRYGREIVGDLREGLADYLVRRGCRSPAELVGRALPRIVPHEELPRVGPVRARIDPDRCIGDGACFVSCRDGGHRAIAFGADRRPVVDDERCVGCGLCALVCPVDRCIEIAARPAPGR
jgi:dihydropyrimidine dehydrogenase (NAD+) subunit PreA